MKKVLSALVIAVAAIYMSPASAGLMKMEFNGNDCQKEGSKNGNDTVYSSPQGFDNCGVWAGDDLISPVIAKYNFGSSGINTEISDNYSDFDPDLISFALESKSWSYDQGADDPNIRFWVAKGGDAFNLFWFIDENDAGKCSGSDLLSFGCLDSAQAVTSGTWEVPQDKGLSHLTFFNSAPSVPVPEPGSLALLGLGLIGLRFARRRSATVK